MRSIRGPREAVAHALSRTAEELLDEAASEIEGSHDVALWRRHVARADAEDLLAEVIGRRLTRPVLRAPLAAPDGRRFARMVRRRVAGEPLPRILGYLRFRGLRVDVADGVFVPRLSSELLAAEAIQRLRRRRGRCAVDVGTGGGAVALAIATEVAGSEVYGVDVSSAAVRLAARNARRLELSNVRFIVGDLVSALPDGLRGSIDVFTMHPPYVPRAEVRMLPAEVKSFEPYESLTDGSSDGLGLVRRLADEGRAWLTPAGWILVEVSPDLARSVATILRRSRYTDVRSLRDRAGATRVITGRIAASSRATA